MMELPQGQVPVLPLMALRPPPVDHVHHLQMTEVDLIMDPLQEGLGVLVVGTPQMTTGQQMV